MDAAGNLSWTNNGNLENPATVNIKGPKGDKGDTGDTGEQGAPGAPGAAATINGVNALTLAAGENVELEQSGSTLTISASAGGPLYVQFTGSDQMNLSTDHTLEEVVAAYRGGRDVIAVYDSVNYTLVCIDSANTMAQFTFFAQSTMHELFMLNSGGLRINYCTETQISASLIKFSPGSTGIDADNVQDAIEYLASLL